MKNLNRLTGSTGKPEISIELRGTTYHARFKILNKAISDGRPYVTETLGTKDADEAVKKAYQRLHAIRAMEIAGLPLKSKFAADEIAIFIKEYERGLEDKLSGFSHDMLRQFRRTIGRYWKEYLGHKPMATIGLPDMEGYEGWRVGYWRRWIDEKQTHAQTNKRGPSAPIKLPSNAKMVPSRRTLTWEISSFKQFIKWCVKNRNYEGNADAFVFEKGPPARRSSFSNHDYTKLTSVMRRKAWLNVGKYQNDSGLRRHREMLRAYVLFLANTGIRIGEARYLRWSDLVYATDKSGAKYLSITVAQSYSKTKRRRNVVGMPKAMEVMQEFFKSRKERQDFCEKSDFIWCDRNGKVIKDFREGFNSLLQLADCERDNDGRKRTIYSLRHFYITERLKADVPIYFVASNCGTSVAMIERYYSDARPSDFVAALTRTKFPVRYRQPVTEDRAQTTVNARA